MESDEMRIKRLEEEKQKLRDVLIAWTKAHWLAGIHPIEESNDPLETLLFKSHAILNATT